MFLTSPPQPPPLWDHTADEISRLAKEFIAKARVSEDKVGSLTSEECNFRSVFLALAEAENQRNVIFEPLSFYQNVSPSKELREASSHLKSLVQDFVVESSMRFDLYQAKITAEKNIKASGEWEKLSSEERRLVDKMVLEGTRAGLALSEEDQNELTIVKKELSQICLEFSRNCNNENGTISLTAEELKGVPQGVISGYTKRVDNFETVYDVTYKVPDIFPIFKFAESPKTRQKAFEGYESRLDVNVSLLDRALTLRRTIAELLGYASWADYITEVKMIKSSKNVVDLLDDLQQKLKPVGLQDREILLAMKMKEHLQQGIPFDGEFYIWDYWYYDRKFVKETLDLDETEVKEYFPVTFVVSSILSIYQDLLGVQFEKIHGSTWHPDVQQYAVWEKDATDASGFIGYCYLDLFPREYKFPHAAVWSLLPGYDLPQGERSYPVAAMVANLAKPTPEKPALMRHPDVVTFFHEMGHVFHNLLSKTKFARFDGTNVAGDFVEAPSKMLENWCWEPRVLKQISSHHQTKQPLSPELIEKITKSRYLNIGLFFLRQLFFCKFDIQVHIDKDAADSTQLWNTLREQISLVKSVKMCPGQGSFGHIAGGYDAGYYGYTYSLVFAADMYETVFKADPLDPACGKRYREEILSPGGSRDEIESLEHFLGRPPNSDAFLRSLFGTVMN